MYRVKHWIRFVMISKTLVHEIRIISCYSNNMAKVIKKDEADWQIIGKQLAMIKT